MLVAMQRLILFAKRPRAGRVKTRLSPPLRPQQALGLYRAFLEDQLAFLGRFAPQRQIELCWDGPPEPGDLPGRAPAALRIAEQGPGDLGARLLRGFRRSRAERVECSVAIGVDSPTLPRGAVEAAFDGLASGAAAVSAPADDGGYVLIGLREPHAELFRDVPWGESGVMQATRERAATGGVALVELPGGYDVDDVGGLRRLQRELTDPACARRAPATARALALLDWSGNGVL